MEFTGFSNFSQVCWAQHIRRYPNQQIQKEMEEFHNQCSRWWHKLSQENREKWQKEADKWPQQKYTYLYTDIAVHTNPSSVIEVLNSESPYGCSYEYRSGAGCCFCCFCTILLVITLIMFGIIFVFSMLLN